MAETDEVIETTKNTTDTSEQLSDKLVELEADTSEVIEEEVIGKIAEVISLREENAKHFRLDNGMYKVVSYSAPVHRLDADGTWQDINNNLYLQEANGSVQYATNDGRVQFADRFAAGEELFRLSEGEYSITMKWLEPTGGALGNITADATAQPPQITNAATRPANHTFESIEEAVDVDNTAKIVYNNVRTGIDLEYVLMGNDVKENIIVKDRASSYEYAFQIGLNGLTATLNAAGEVELKDAESGVTQYVIPAPYMYDSAGVYSQAVSYQLAEVSTGRYLLLITADATWINAEERVFPVTVDPTVTDKMLPVDNYTDSTRPDTNLENDNRMLISDTCTSYIRIRLPELPEGAIPTAGRFHVEYYFDTTTGNMTVGAYVATETWSGDMITHNNAPALDPMMLDSVVMTAGTNVTTSNPAVAVFNVSPAVLSWYASGIEFPAGFAFKKLSGNTQPVYLKAYEMMARVYSFYEVDYSYTLPDGVYALRNRHLATKWMKLSGCTTSVGTPLQYCSYDSAPADVFKREALFKISNIEGTDQYIIRSMINNRVGLSVSDTGIIVSTFIPENDENVPNENTFRIEWDGFGYSIYPYGSTKAISLIGLDDEGTLTAEENPITDNRRRWDLIMYTGVHRNGSGGTYPERWKNVGIFVGDSDNIDVWGWSTYINTNTITVQATTPTRQIATVDWHANDQKIRFVARKLGRVYMSIYFKDSASSTNVAQTTLTYSIIPQEGDYYIANQASEKYIRAYNSSTKPIVEWGFSTDIRELWMIEHAGQGYIRIRAKYNGQYLGINSSMYSKVVLMSSTSTSGVLWKIETSAMGEPILVCMATQGYALGVANASNHIDGIALTQLSYTVNMSPRGCWTFYECNYTLETTHYYDDGFDLLMERYGYADPVAKIEEYQLTVAERFMHIFGLRITYTIGYFADSPADTCKELEYGDVLDSNLDGGTVNNSQIASCNHSTTHLTTDTLRTKLFKTINPVRNNISTAIIWTGHEMINNEHANSNSNSHSIVMTPYYILQELRPNINAPSVSSTRVNRVFIALLMHELSHQLGAPDHYCYDENATKCKNDFCDECVNNYSSPRECIMTNLEDYWNSSRDMYCPYCTGEIKRHLANHHSS